MLVMNGFQKNNLLLVKKIVRYLPKIITVNYKNNQVLYKQLKKFQTQLQISNINFIIIIFKKEKIPLAKSKTQLCLCFK